MTLDTPPLRLDEPDPLFEQEKALILCATAARGWSARSEGQPFDSATLVRQLMRAAGSVGRAYRGLGRPPPSLGDVVGFFSRPVADWLPGFTEEPLLDGGIATPLCADL